MPQSIGHSSLGQSSIGQTSIEQTSIEQSSFATLPTGPLPQTWRTGEGLPPADSPSDSIALELRRKKKQQNVDLPVQHGSTPGDRQEGRERKKIQTELNLRQNKSIRYKAKRGIYMWR